MQSQIKARERSSSPIDRTLEAMRRQVVAMASDVFEIGLFKPDATGNEAVMLPRVWMRHAIAVRGMATPPEPGWPEYLYPSAR